MSSLPTNLIKEFVEITNDSKPEKKPIQLYGIVHVLDDGTYVQLDGSDVLTPVVNVVDSQTGDRVLVTIENHTATILGNYTYPPSQRDTITAQETADEAINTAQKAQTNADNAYQAAEEASVNAEEAQELASEAATKAEVASKAAAEAKTQATNAETQAKAASDAAQAVTVGLKDITDDLLTVKTDASQTLAAAIEASTEKKVEVMTSSFATKNDLKEQKIDLKSEIERSAGKIQTTLSASYTRKTDLTEAMVEMQSQITQTAEAIELTVLDITDAMANTHDENVKAQIAQAKIDFENAKAALANAKTSLADARKNEQVAKDNLAASQNTLSDANAELAEVQSDLQKAQSYRDELIELGVSTEKIEAAEADVKEAEDAVAATTTKVNQANADVNAASAAIINAQNAVVTAEANIEDAQEAYDLALNGLHSYNMTAIKQTADAINLKASKSDLDGYVKTTTFELTADGFTAQIDTAKKDAAAAQSVANTAKSTADSAKTTATNASTTASNAANTANSASTAASNAQNTANSAATAATNAQNTANAASTAASNAQNTANAASTAASNAQNTANTARTEAANAAKTATNYLGFSDNGLVVGNMTASTLGNNVLIDGSSVNIRNGSTVLATFNADSISLAKNNTGARILLCGEKGEIGLSTIWDTSFLTMSSDLVALKGVIARLYADASCDGSCSKADAPKAEVYCGTYYGSGSNGAYTQIICECPTNDDSVAEINLDASSYSNPYITIGVDGAGVVGDAAEITIVPEKITLEASDVKISGKLNVVDEIFTQSNIRVNGKTINDLAEGIFISKEGYMQIQRLSGSPYIDFIYSDQAASCGRVGINTSTKYMEFTKSSRYMYDATVEITGGSIASYNSMYVGYGAAYTAGRGLYFPYADEANHAAVYRGTDGLTTYFGWAGSSSYSTVSILRGRTVRYSNSSGTTTLSDERLKKDFTKLEQWDAFYDALEPCAFKMKNGSSGRYHIGFKAGQVEQALIDTGLSTNDFAGFIKMPYLPDEDDPEGCKVYEEAGINAGDNELGLIYSEFTALNTYKIQKMQKRIDELEKLVEQLLSS